ncbi:DNA methyltransferase [Peribacillus sp. SCS-26]|uniref:DNA methyltransferase n=1 Tax=Paraperibacillus marinus TaxID=3115295 RepID=UPI003905B085
MIVLKEQQDVTNYKITALESNFPIVELSEVAEKESWRKEIYRPIYHIHKWWATRLGSVFRAITLGALTPESNDIWKEFYKKHDLKDKVVLDPFMGSGTTIGETIKLGAKAIGCDINPISTFLVNQAFNKVSEKELREAYENLENKIAPEIKKYYKTLHPLTGELIPVLYYFWVKIVTLPDGEEVPLFSKYVFSQNAYPKKKPAAKILCPNCWSVIEDRYDSVSVTCPNCNNEFNPQEGPVSGQYVSSKNGKKYKIKDLLPRDGSQIKHSMYAVMAATKEGEKIYLPVGDYDHKLYAEAERRIINEDLPIPTLDVRSGHNTDQARGYNYLKWKDFFNTRQLLCLGLLLKGIIEEIKDEVLQEQMLCLFSSTLEFNNMFCSFKGEGTGAVRHMFSNHILKPERTPLENSVWGTKKSSGTFSSLFSSRLLKAKEYLNEPFEVKLKYDDMGKNCGTEKVIASNPVNVQVVDNWEKFNNNELAALILNGDSSSIPIPDSTVNAVITDPPYFDFIHYSELSDFFFAWLSPVLKHKYEWMARANSYDSGEVQHNEPKVFANQLASVFSECCRVLKDDGILAFSFHHSKPEGWAAIYQAINRAGLTVTAVHPVHAEARASSPKSSAKDPISLDSILVCRKQRYMKENKSDYTQAVKKSDNEFLRLENSGMKLSRGDRFVVSAAQLLIKEGTNKLEYEEIKERLAQVRNSIFV